MNKTKNAIFALVALLGTGAAVGVSQFGEGINLRAADVNTWKHFAAVMPTDTTKGIREYWSDCVGGVPQFVAPEGVTASEATLSDDQKNSILADDDDTRIIPTLSDIKRSVAKGYDGKSSTQGYDVNCAYAYTYLDDATKAEVPSANEENIVSAYETYNDRFTVMNLPLQSGGQGTFDFNASETYVDGYGVVYEMISGVPAMWANFKYEDSAFVLSDYDYISFYVYNPTDSVWSDVWVREINWADASQLTFSVKPHSWSEIKISKDWFGTYTGSKFANWWLGIINYKGYESATETLKISKPVAVKSAAAALDFDAVVSEISSITSPTKLDAYYIYEAGKLLADMSDGAKAHSSKLSDYNTAKGNCSEFVTWVIDPATCACSVTWDGAKASSVTDSDYGKITKLEITAAGQAVESKIGDVTVDSTVYDTVSFYVKSDFDAKFLLSKQDWSHAPYDFSTGSFGDDTQSFDAVNYWVYSANGWTKCTMSATDFNECKYFMFFNSKLTVGESFSISPIYVSKSAS